MEKSFLKSIQGVHLLVAGEVGIDEYLWGETRRISPEAPVPVVEVNKQELKLGLGANVAQNIASLGGKVTLVSVRGEDPDGDSLKNMLDLAGISKSILLADASRPTLRKVRVIAQRQHVVRIDYERSHVLEAKVAKQFTESICDEIPRTDGVIVQDYGKGLWNADTISIIKRARELKKPIFVDPNRNTSVSLYRGATFLTPNTAEAEILSQMVHDPKVGAGMDDAYLSRIGKRILELAEAENVIITCGEHGMVAISRGKTNLLRIPTFARDVFDVTGAGDTVVSVLALISVLGQPLTDCMQIANAAAGLVVGRIGASSVTPQELETELERLEKLGLIP